MKLSKLNKKGQLLNQFSSLAIGIAGLVIVMSVVFLILSNVAANSQVTADANATKAVATLTNAAADLPAWIPIVIVAAVGLVLFGLVRLFQRGT